VVELRTRSNHDDDNTLVKMVGRCHRRRRLRLEKMVANVGEGGSCWRRLYF